MRIGEIWFTIEPLLLKFLVTAEKLSVQVHPDDDYAARHEAARGGRGKTEIWYVIAAKPGASVALGFQQPMTREEIRAAALDGSLEAKLHWMEVKVGQLIYVPAGTVHALGAGLEVCEIQQNCDITYRLFDYGRGRELHLERGLDVISGDMGMAPGAGIVELPFAGKYFGIEMPPAASATPPMIGPGDLVILNGEGKLGDQDFSSREVWSISEPVEFRPSRATESLLVRT
jgi:mannose-6-phosphate isomerase